MTVGFPSQVLEVVNLAVIGNYQVRANAGLKRRIRMSHGHRLCTVGAEIDDAQAPVLEYHVPVAEQAISIGSAVTSALVDREIDHSYCQNSRTCQFVTVVAGAGGA